MFTSFIDAMKSQNPKILCSYVVKKKKQTLCSHLQILCNLKAQKPYVSMWLEKTSPMFTSLDAI